ncbi:MAG: carboxypeptidase-like regulatory domain-containing protein [Bacteroidetes bacterium]|nr:carboxypeptidase-like regulatory domain-containing protein [Bacteroidota bacterium]
MKIVAFKQDMMKFTLLVFQLLCIAQLFGQTAVLKGKVTDALNRPLKDITIYLKEDKSIQALSNQDGNYTLKIPAERKWTLIISRLNFRKIEKKINPKDGENLDINGTMVIKELKTTIVKGGKKIRTEVSMNEMVTRTDQVNPSGNLENMLKFQGIGVAGNNELSSSYSVRGGNFDENLVYVNDFEIYRPFLIRSGQQEGLSFANPNMVQNIKFSSGGFAPKYGDKIASVLDIKYKKPDKLRTTGELSFLGGAVTLEGASKSRNTTFIGGFRFKSAQYLLGSLDVKGQYQPSFLDIQTYVTQAISPKLSIDWLTNYSSNAYYFAPETRTTRFGLVNYTLDFTVKYEGSENDKYQNFMTGVSATYKANDRQVFKLLAAHYRTQENERYDITGKYVIGEVETDINKPNFNEVKSALGFGQFQNWARNQLNTEIYYAGAKASFQYNKHTVSTGIGWKFEHIKDKLSEWTMTDSAGYSLPLNHDEMKLESVIKSTHEINSQRAEGYVQDAWTWDRDSAASFGFTYGLRYNYWYYNKELLISPRAQFYYIPNTKKNWVITGAVGLYQQPPYYRELRDFSGKINPEVKAQKSLHYILGSDLLFKAGNRPFKFTTELYYKHLWDVNQYDYQNVLIRYVAKNNAVAYATGVDFRVQGELVEGAERWVNLSFMQTKEFVGGLTFYNYKDDTGGIFPSISYTNRDIVDSIPYERGYVNRPTNQLVSFNVFFEDYIPNHPEFRVHLNLSYGSGFPFGPVNNDKFRNAFQFQSYKRVDIGFSAMLYDIKKRKVQYEKVQYKHLKSIWATLEVFNLLGISNEVSKEWIKDYSNRIYAIPNYLTGRRVNLRIVVKF